jgi:sugar phosphate permease
MLRKIYEWNPPFPFFYGWAILGVSFFSTFAATSVAQVVLGGIQMYILEDTGWAKTDFSLTIAIGTWISGFISPFIGRWADKYGPRQLMPLALVIIALCYFGIYGIPAFWSFVIGYIIARALSTPILISIVPRTVTVNFFRKRRNMALSIVTMSRPVAGAINIQLISFITSQLGWRAAYNILGWFTLSLSIPIFFIMRRKPEDIGINPDGDMAYYKEEETTAVDLTEYSWTFRDAIKTPAFWLLAGVSSFVTLASSSVQFTLVPYYVEHLGLSKFEAASIFSLGTVLALATFLWGMVADRFSPRILLIAILCVASGLLVLLLNIHNAYQAWGFAVLWGVFSGAVQEMAIEAVLAQYFGRGAYGSISGAIGPMQITALGFGTTFGALIHSISGSYNPVYITIAVIYLSCAVMAIVVKPPKKPININQLSK